MIPKKKYGSGASKKTSPRTDKLLKREATSYLSITAAESKNKHNELLHNVSTRSIRHQLPKDLCLPGRRAAKKSMLTAAIKKKRLNVCQKYRHCTAAEWRKVMFSDESTFTLVKEVPYMIRRPSSASRYDPKFMVKTMKRPGSAIMWELSVKCGSFQASLYFLAKNVIMKGSIYMNILIKHLCTS